MIDELEKCSNIFTSTGNYFELGSYAGFFLVTTIFAFTKKSIPGIVKSLLEITVKTFQKK